MVKCYAPGVGILTTDRPGSAGYESGDYTFNGRTGTSYSAPHVAGLAGLIISKNGSLPPAKVRSIIQYTSKDLGAFGWDQYFGWGRINAYDALRSANGQFTLSGSLSKSECWYGTITLTGNVTIPSGYTLGIASGTRENDAVSRRDQLVQNYAGKEIFGLSHSLAVGDLVKRGQYAEAIDRCLAILQDFPGTTLAKYALYDLGSIYWYRLYDQKTGEAYYRQLIAQWPGDDLTISALATLGEWNPVPGKESTPSLTELQGIPIAYRLSQNFPNPFNPQTEIRYQLPEASRITLQVYNFLGQKVRTLVDGQREAGYHSIVWDSRDDLGRKVASGIYFYRLSAEPSAVRPEGFLVTRKMVLMQ